MLLFKPPDAEDDYSEDISCENAECANFVKNAIHHGFTDRPGLTLRTSICLFMLKDSIEPGPMTKRYFTISRVAAALHELKFPICLHICTSDRRHVYELFTLECTGDRCRCYRGDAEIPTIREHYKTCRQCEARLCHTSFGFRTWEGTRNGRKAVGLYLDTFRDLGCMENGTEPGWYCHALGSAWATMVKRRWGYWIEFRESRGAEWEQYPFPTFLGFLGTVFKTTVLSVKDTFIPQMFRTGARSEHVSKKRELCLGW